MDTLLTPLSFENRKAPGIAKVQADAERMYAHARYVIVLDQYGNVKEGRSNRRSHDNVVDCLAVFAPFVYNGIKLEKVLALEIGFRRFVPYAHAEYRLNSSTRRGPRIRRRRSDDKVALIKKKAIPRNKRPKMKSLQPRVPVVELTKEAIFDLLPAISTGIQTCVDDIVQGWTGTMGLTIRWAPSGTEVHRFWNKHEIEPAIDMRIPKEADVLCATATFAESKWRLHPQGHIGVSARAINDMLKYMVLPGRRLGRDKHGDFDDDYVREGATFHWVAERLKQKVDRGYTVGMVQGLFDLIGPPGSIGRRLVEQVWKIFKIPEPRDDELFQSYQPEYGEMKDLLLERWLVQTCRFIRREKKRKEWIIKRTSKRPYFPHAANCHIFSVFASKEAQDRMTEAYCERRALKAQTENVQPTQETFSGEEDDIPFDSGPAQKTGTDDDDNGEPPF